MGRSFLWKTSVKGHSLKALAQLLDNAVRGVLGTNASCSSVPEKNKGASHISTLSFHHSYATSLQILEKIHFIGRLRAFALSCLRYLEGGREPAESKMQKPQAWGASRCNSPLFCLSQKNLSIWCSLLLLPGRKIHVWKINKETSFLQG